ncbi:hypothetical protein [Paenibacillus sp. OK003]|uniref:hypothetical protein n=1 Tax=Paenibacillus sp. OK003 TaxID=1884380 RepID=UPI0008C52194|nr:hypothetical protein [Paenibacillus sp. OK003]SEL90073.1 hypothetical protein SAMN05518856_12299 [Paenibacillus sp. OK003]
MKPTYRIVIVVVILALLNLSLVLFSDISIPVERKGNFYTTEKVSFGMMFCLCTMFILGAIAGIGATSEKALVDASVLWSMSVWLFMLAIQYCRIVYHKGLFDGLTFSIAKWTAIFLVIHIVSAFLLHKIDKRRKEREDEERWKENIKKVGIQYVYTFDDGSEITVTQEDMRLEEG